MARSPEYEEVTGEEIEVDWRYPVGAIAMGLVGGLVGLIPFAGIIIGIIAISVAWKVIKPAFWKLVVFILGGAFIAGGIVSTFYSAALYEVKSAFAEPLKEWGVDYNEVLKNFPTAAFCTGLSDAVMKPIYEGLRLDALRQTIYAVPAVATITANISTAIDTTARERYVVPPEVAPPPEVTVEHSPSPRSGVEVEW